MERRAPKGEFRANVHLGGSVHPVNITPLERELSIRATKALGLKVSGVDILRSKTGAKVIEINASPGLEGIEKATGKDIAGSMIEFAEKHAKRTFWQWWS